MNIVYGKICRADGSVAFDDDGNVVCQCDGKYKLYKNRYFVYLQS